MRVSAWWWWLWRRGRRRRGGGGGGGTVTSGSARVRAGFLGLVLAVTLFVYGYWRLLAPLALYHTSLVRWFDTRKTSVIGSLTFLPPANSTIKLESYRPTGSRIPTSLTNTYPLQPSIKAPVFISGLATVSDRVVETVNKNNQSLSENGKRFSESEFETLYKIDFPSWWEREATAQDTEGVAVVGPGEGEDMWEYRGGVLGGVGEEEGGDGGIAGEDGDGGEEVSAGGENGGLGFFSGGEGYESGGGGGGEGYESGGGGGGGGGEGYESGGGGGGGGGGDLHEDGVVVLSTGGQGYGGEAFSSSSSSGDEGIETVTYKEEDNDEGFNRTDEEKDVKEWKRRSDEQQHKDNERYTPTQIKQNEEEEKRGKNDQEKDRKRKEEQEKGREDREVNREEKEGLVNEKNRNLEGQNYTKVAKKVNQKTTVVEVKRGRMIKEVKEEQGLRTEEGVEKGGQRTSKDEGKQGQIKTRVEEKKSKKTNDGKTDRGQTKSEVTEKQGKKTNQDQATNQGQREEQRGQRSPRVILLLSSWRSGSTFLGEILATADNNNTFYSYEPLHEWKVRLVREDSGSTRTAVQLLTDLLHCRLYLHPHHLAYMTSKHWYLRWNTRLASHCLHNNQCTNTTLATQLCTTSHIHVAKVVRLGLHWVLPLLQDPSLNLQLVVLVRDPRAVLSSRARVPWCQDPSCSHPPTVCQAMYQDLRLLPHLLRQYPTRVKMVQYERFLLDLHTSLPDLLSFLHLPLSPAHLHLLILAAKSLGPSRAESKRGRRRKRSTYLDSGKYSKRSIHRGSVNENIEGKKIREALNVRGHYPELNTSPDQHETLDQGLAEKLLRKAKETLYKKRSDGILEENSGQGSSNDDVRLGKELGGKSSKLSSNDGGLGKELGEKSDSGSGWSERGTYGTERDLVRQQAELWRHHTSFRQVVEYQRHCGRVLALLGLRVFTSRAQLSNHALPVLLTRSQQQLSRRAHWPLN
ncbi:hypothetical protein Pmani_012791 [Petrolisthes manimaculis]|uniref:Sulfotransferase n=1 Tax=Petrolisthes manimaculis TaxID=1843537 RepID=A0AAE1Q049_9EUCA|nr:hypothetical protein Pmani_012791 [Petrolisthes manimaculis]